MLVQLYRNRDEGSNAREQASRGQRVRLAVPNHAVNRWFSPVSYDTLFPVKHRADVSSKISKYTGFLDRRMIFGVIALLFIIILASSDAAYEQNTFKLFLYFVSVCVLTLFTLPYFLDRDKITVVPAILFLFAVFVLVRFLPVIWADHTYDVPIYMAAYGIHAVFLFLAANFVKSKSHLLYISISSLVLMVLLAIVAALEYAELIQPYGRWEPNRLMATMGNTNYLGGLLVMLLPLGAAFLLYIVTRHTRTSADKNRSRSISVVIIAAAALALVSGLITLVSTLSRGAWLGAFVAGVVFVLVMMKVLRHEGENGAGTKKAVRRMLLGTFVLLLLVLVIVLAAPPLRHRVDARLGALGRLFATDHTSIFANRIPVWKAGVRTWLSDPPASIIFGRGLGSFYVHVFTYYPGDHALYTTGGRGAKHAHSEYLHLLAEGGVLSLLLWLALITTAILLSARVIKNRRCDIAHRIIAAALLAGISGMVAHSGVGLLLNTVAVKTVFLLLLVLSAANARIAGNGEESTSGKGVIRNGFPLRKAPARIAAAVVIIAVCAASLAWGSRYYGSQVSHQNAQKLGGTAAPPENRKLVLDYFNQALSRNPRNIYARYTSILADADGPGQVLENIEKIEKIIPNYKSTALTKGLVQADMGDYSGAEESFKRHVSNNLFDLKAPVHLIACLLMQKKSDEAVNTLKTYLQRQHVMFQTNRGEYVDLGPVELSFKEDSARLTGGFDNRTGITHADIGMERLRALIGELNSESRRPYRELLPELYYQIGSIFQDLNYSDVELTFYDLALQAGLRDTRKIEEIYRRYEYFYDMAYEKASAANRVGADHIEARMTRFMDRYREAMEKLETTR